MQTTCTQCTRTTFQCWPRFSHSLGFTPLSSRSALSTLMDLSMTARQTFSLTWLSYFWCISEVSSLDFSAVLWLTTSREHCWSATRQSYSSTLAQVAWPILAVTWTLSSSSWFGSLRCTTASSCYSKRYPRVGLLSRSFSTSSATMIAMRFASAFWSAFQSCLSRWAGSISGLRIEATEAASTELDCVAQN